MYDFINKEIAESTVIAEDQTVIIRVGSRFNRHEEMITGATLTNITTRHGDTIGFYIVDLTKYAYCQIKDDTMMRLPFRKIGPNTWKLND